MTRLALLLLSLLFSVSVDAASHRDRSVRNAFQRENPCPDKAVQIRPGTAGGRRGACPGYEVDHIVPLCFGIDVDRVENLQWLSVADHKKKTKLDIKVCNWR